MALLLDDECTLVSSNGCSILTDQHGVEYIAAFDGNYICLRKSGGSSFAARWLQGSGKIEGLPGGGALSPKFAFTFYDHGTANQRLNATWTFAGTPDEAVAAFAKAGYRLSKLDNRHNREHHAPPGVTLLHLRTRGAFFTGGDSGHAILYLAPHDNAVPAHGELHVGEHNPTTGLGLGFLFHRLEIRKRATHPPRKP